MVKSIAFLKRTIMAAERPTITLLVGLPGSGKSSWIKNNGSDLVVISSDNLFEAWASAHQITYSEAFRVPGLFKEIEEEMFFDLAEAIENKQHIVVDRTNLSVKSRNKMLANVPPEYLKFAAIFAINREELDRRLAVRNESGKMISKEVVDKMIQTYQFPTKAENFDEIFLA